MKPNSHPCVVIRKIYNAKYAKDGEKQSESKTTQLFLPEFDSKTALQIAKIIVMLLLLLAVITGKIKEAAPIVNYILEQLP